jgi:anti-sigma regulatory factor (Ser/Thr protein kinase)
MCSWQAHGAMGDIRQVRELVARAVHDQPEATRDAAVLLVDECVANAVQYGGGEFHLTVERRSGVLRVEVVDQSPHLPMRVAPDDDSERGRGLAIVDELASRWGADGLANGKMVWFELALE